MLRNQQIAVASAPTSSVFTHAEQPWPRAACKDQIKSDSECVCRIQQCGLVPQMMFTSAQKTVSGVSIVVYVFFAPRDWRVPKPCCACYCLNWLVISSFPYLQGIFSLYQGIILCADTNQKKRQSSSPRLLVSFIFCPSIPCFFFCFF